MQDLSGINPLILIITGFLMAVAGFVVLFLMVIRVIEAGFLLNFLSYGSSFFGLILGLIGVSQYTIDNRGGY